MKNKNTTTVEANYYDAFVDSILSLPEPIRGFVLQIGTIHSKDNNCYNYLWELYCNDDIFIRNLLDHYKLAID